MNTKKDLSLIIEGYNVLAENIDNVTIDISCNINEVNNSIRDLNLVINDWVQNIHNL